MPWFSRPVERVSATRVFARVAGDRQWLAYATTVRSSSNVALIVPLPVPPGTRPSDVRFHDLSDFPEMFVHVQELFESTAAMAVRGGLGRELDASMPSENATGAPVFLPARQDLERMDARFRSADSVLASLPSYADFGFAVVTVKAAKEDTPLPPIVVECPTRRANVAFFPGVQVHDGTVARSVPRDETFFLQLAGGVEALEASELPWQESGSLPNAWLSDESRGVIAPKRAVWRAQLGGMRHNGDFWAP